MRARRDEQPIVSLTGVRKVYPPSTVALTDVNLEIDRGEFVFLIGPSGAGKSTLMRLLYREEQASAGRILVNGLELTEMRLSEVPFLRRQIGVVFQDFKLLPRKTVSENIAFPLVVSEFSGREIRRRVAQLLEIVGLTDRRQALPAELSGGEQQRAALARAIVNNPALLIADEPTGNLDPETSRGITQLLAEINLRGTTMVVATHSELMVNTLRRRVVAIEGGTIVRDQARAVYHQEDRPRPAEGDRRLAAAGAAPGAWPGRGARRG